MFKSWIHRINIFFEKNQFIKLSYNFFSLHTLTPDNYPFPYSLKSLYHNETNNLQLWWQFIVIRFPLTMAFYRTNKRSLQSIIVHVFNPHCISQVVSTPFPKDARSRSDRENLNKGFPFVSFVINSKVTCHYGAKQITG